MVNVGKYASPMDPMGIELINNPSSTKKKPFLRELFNLRVATRGWSRAPRLVHDICPPAFVLAPSRWL